MLIQDRIKIIIKANNESPSSFADKINIKRSNLSHVLSGRNKPSFDFLSKVLSAYPKVNASWLITGDINNYETVDISQVKPAKTISPTTSQELQGHDIERIVIFYSDNTFESYNPNEQ